MANPTESTHLLHRIEAAYNDSFEEAEPTPRSPRFRLHSHAESIVPEFILTTMAEAVVEIAHEVEEIAHELTTFEPFNIEEHLPISEKDPLHVQTDLDEKETSYDEILHPHDPMAPFESRQKLGVLPLAVMVFYSVSGGPFGCETSVRAAGNFYALLGFTVLPFVWSLQEALMTAELGTAFPEASGGVAWVEEAFGSTAGWMNGYLGWVAGATDNAIYPVLFLDYLLQSLGDGAEDMNKVLRFCLLAVTSMCLGYVNWLGLPLVGTMSVSICAIAMSPFIILTVVGAFKVDPSRWFELPVTNSTMFEAMGDDDVSGGFFPNAALGGVLWRPFLNNIFWNLNSFDAAGSFAADIEDPARVFPRAMGIAFVLVLTCYLFPLLVAIGATQAEQHEWVSGFLVRVTGEVVGPWLGAWTVFASGISNIALFQAELSADAFQLMGMADRGHVPKLFSHRSRHGTPTFGIILGTSIIVILGASHLDQLIEMLNFNYAIALLLEFCAFVKLRIARPDLERPYRVPLNTLGCILFLAPTFILTLTVLFLAAYSTLLFCLGCNIVGMLIFHGKQRSDFMRGSCYVAKDYKQVDGSSVNTAAEGDSASEMTPENSSWIS